MMTGRPRFIIVDRLHAMMTTMTDLLPRLHAGAEAFIYRAARALRPFSFCPAVLLP